MRITLLLALLSFLACSSDSTEGPEVPLRIYAAASLSSVLPEVSQAFQRSHPRANVEYNFAASSILARQIEEGARADIFFSANTAWMDYLERKRIIRPVTRREFLSNRLVLIVPLEGDSRISGVRDLTLPGVQKIALADWSHVPAGMYAKETLEKLEIWPQVVKKCIAALDVRAAVSYVERGDADCGIVYQTDAAVSRRVKIVEVLPLASQPRIRYAVAITSRSSHPSGKLFLNFLLSDTAHEVFVRNGFVVLENGVHDEQ